ncbi:MAG: aminopeptidase P family protein [Alphaproteobacteria bacterium]|nr:aminopeptidase P family protein [Alphaproteobacteria bacterium]
MPQRYFPLEEYEGRWERAHREMRKRGIGAAVVWGRSNQTYDRSGDVLYLTNYYCPEVPPDTPAWHAWGYYAVILEPGEEPELVVDAADDRTMHLATQRISRFQNIIEGLAGRLKARRLRRPIAMVGTDVLAWKYGRELELAADGATWIPADDLIRSVRRVKSAREFDLLREGGAISARALDVMMKELVACKPERDAVAAAIGVLYRAGGHGSYISANHGDSIKYWCREPLIGRSADAPRPGDLVRGWMDSIYHGYWFDPGRTAVAGGRPTPAQRQVIDDCVKIIKGVTAAIRPGARTSRIAEIGEQLVASVGGNAGGVSETFGAFAHGIGLHWEPPYIGKATDDSDSEITEGMAMGVEYFLTREGVGTVGIEENFLVLADHNESIVNLPMQGW